MKATLGKIRVYEVLARPVGPVFRDSWHCKRAEIATEAEAQKIATEMARCVDVGGVKIHSRLRPVRRAGDLSGSPE